MLSTPNVSELPDRFGAYFGRAAKFLLTGHFFDVALTPEEVSASTTEEQTFTVQGILPTDLLVVTKPTHQAGLGIVNARASAANTIALTFMNSSAGAITPTSETYIILALRRERE